MEILLLKTYVFGAPVLAFLFMVICYRAGRKRGYIEGKTAAIKTSL